MSAPLQILFPNGQVEAVQVYIWDVNTLQPIVWTGAVTGGGGGGGGAVTIADGADVAEGFTTDAAVVGDVNGTVSAKLRGLSKIWNDIWDSVNHRIRVDGSGVTQPISGSVTVSGSVTTTPPSNASTNITQVGGSNLTLGQSTGANSIPVVLASNVALPTGANTIGAVNQGLPTTLANSWPIEITDGSNGPVVVRPPSSPPVSTDRALVTTLNPTSPSPLNNFVATAISLSSIGATSTQNLSNNPSNMITVLISSLGNPFNNVVFEAQCEDAIFRQMPLLAMNGSIAGQFVDGSSLLEGIIYTFNASAFPTVRVRVNAYASSVVSGAWAFSPQGVAPNKIVQSTAALVDASPAPLVSGYQPLSLTTSSQLRVQTVPEEYVDFFGDIDLGQIGDSLGVPNFNLTEVGNLL